MASDRVTVIVDRTDLVTVIAQGPQGPPGESSKSTVSSVFGRTGAVAKAAGDYAIGDITGLQSALEGKQDSSTAATDAELGVERAAREAAVTQERLRAETSESQRGDPFFSGETLAQVEAKASAVLISGAPYTYTLASSGVLLDMGAGVV